MPQIFNVLKCYKCSVFQVHLTKKSNKWECKLCGEKQSVKRFYGLGTAKECRFHVQKLNAMRGELDGMTSNIEQDNVSSSENEETITHSIKDDKPVKDSKWSCYVEETESLEADTDTNMSLGGAEVVLAVPKKRRKLNTNRCKTNSILSTLGHEKIDNDNKVSSLSPAMSNANTTQANMQSITPTPSPQLEAYHPEETFKKTKCSDKFIPPLINKNSKWAQFTDAPDLTDDASSFPHVENKDSSSTKIKMEQPDLPDQTSSLPPLVTKDGLCTEIRMERPFAWCDDEPDVDSILSF